MPLNPDDKLLVHLPSPAPAGWLEAMARRFPGLAVRWEVAGIDAAASDLESADSLPREALDGVTLLCVYPPPSPAVMERVRVVQLASAGSDRWLGHEKYRDPGVVFCSSSGRAGRVQIAEWVMGAWLSHQHHFRVYDEQQRQATWNARVADKPVADSLGRRVGIVGYGAIGRQCARLAHALGMHVYAYTRTERPDAPSRRHNGYYNVPGTGDPDGRIPERWFHGDAGFDDLLAQGLDLLILALPLTESTRGLIGRPQFRLMDSASAGRMRKTFLCNVARGPIVDTPALVEALEQGRISGAALDVTDPEPLPAEHPLWKAPNVFITPHVSWQSDVMVERIAGLIMENLERLDKGEPLLNLIKK
ncbi:d-isomer specific 2-hydroxyacid dehydrogenase, NAD binding domain-containing protein [Hirsutella rhossiliensis]|uniref:D-isomer specific 2-hydroxyacid dehydrogenase, NAD binding domain-containing protein n=1 Tax=Hirsutella rhossiliensis TaxID=111463 RepID=A0A9P8MZ75_9HYPO|nr:d-isomer specific 2-hydroxyacid dehydrogenase, NAD binding domain-containing protein [Hirsutella rhossiliensis]KAH0964000.1 d-isomer specific 2-hydroxyacid dehydrogenase, NAD binding domain-containing protein [Hirsutella rhossiliensis]